MQQLKSGSLLQSGRYKIEKVLGQGGFGITYLATQELLNRKVTIKEFFYKEYCERDEVTSHVTLGTSSNRELVERFMEKFIKEARTISTLNHPHIIRIYDIFKENNTAYYVMEYIEGMSLAEMVKQQGALSEDVAVGYIKQVTSALEFVHQHSINHLDVKPANIMVRKEDNQAVLIDFGLSKQYDATGEQTSTTPVGISHGYAPMEQYNLGGVGTFSPQTDIYSLGATLYKLVTGNTPPQAIVIFNDGLPELPSNVSSPIREVIKKSMQPKKAERYNSIEEFVRQLNGKTKSVLCDKEETILIQTPNSPKQTEPILTGNESEKTSNYSIALICSFLLLVGIIVWGISVFTKDESSQMKKSAMVAAEMEQQRINDSIAVVRREEAEKRRKDSIDALNEQARLATIRKLEEKERKEETPEELYSKGLKFYNDSQIPIKKKAIPLFEKAAKQGHVKAMYYLGEWYTWAGGNEDYGVMWWEKAAEQGSFDAMYKLGRQYLRGGIGLHRLNSTDKERGYRWLEKAASNGHFEAQTFLGKCYFMEGQDTNALSWWQKAADKGYVQAYNELGNYYRGSVRGKVIDYNKAIEWYEKAANVKTSEGRPARSMLVNIYYKKDEYRNLNRAKYWCQVMIADGCRDQIDNEILDYFEL